MALSYTGRAGNTANTSKSSNIKINVLGDGTSTTLAIALKSGCFAPYYTDDNSILPLQLANAFGTAFFPSSGSNVAYPYTLAIATGVVTMTFATAPPAGVTSNTITVGLIYP